MTNCAHVFRCVSLQLRCSALSWTREGIRSALMLTCAHTYDAVLSWTQEGIRSLRTYLRGEEIRVLRREFSAALVTFHVLGEEFSSKSEILILSTEFFSGLGLRNVLPASEDDVIHVLRQVWDLGTYYRILRMMSFMCSDRCTLQLPRYFFSWDGGIYACRGTLQHLRQRAGSVSGTVVYILDIIYWVFLSRCSLTISVLDVFSVNQI